MLLITFIQGWLTEHKITESFEKKKDYVDRKSAFSVPNGTIAVYLSILASGIKKVVELLFQT